MKIKLWVAGVAMAFTSSMTMAAEGAYFYGAVDLTKGKVSNYCTGIPPATPCNDKNSGYRLSGGYQVISGLGNEGYGIEASYVNAGKTSFPTLSAEMKDTELQLAVIGTLPVADRITVISKVGLAFWSLKTTSTPARPNLSPSGQDFIYGLGAQFEISKSFAVRGLFDTHLVGDSVTGRSHVPTMSLGGIYRF